MAEVTKNILILPNDPILHILSYLNFRDIINCCLVCRRLQETTQADILWKSLCQRYWNIRNCSEDLTWKEAFKIWHKDYGRYIDSYSDIRKAWDQIEDYLEENFFEVYESLQDGLSEEELDSVESIIEHKLPDDLRCSYRIHNGQESNMAGSGLFGSLQVYNFYSNITLLDLKTAARQSVNIYKESTLWQFSGCLVVAEGRQDLYYLRFLALTDQHGYTPGQIFQSTSDRHKSNQRLATTQDGSVFDDYILANSFQEYLTTFGQELEDDLYIQYEGKMSLFQSDPKCFERTGHIEVSAATCFSPETSSVNPPKFCHAYRITFNMDEDAPADESCQLVTRHWTITDADGDEETVEGPGVIGEYPIMRPGTTFSWISCTYFKTEHGNMTGYFTMKNLKTGLLSKLKCPVFHMKCWPYQTSDDRNAKILQQKKDQ